MTDLAAASKHNRTLREDWTVCTIAYGHEPTNVQWYKWTLARLQDAKPIDQEKIEKMRDILFSVADNAQLIQDFDFLESPHVSEQALATALYNAGYEIKKV